MNRITRELQVKHAELLHYRNALVGRQQENFLWKKYSDETELTQQSRTDINGRCVQRDQEISEQLENLDKEISLIVQDLSPAPD